MVIGVVREVGLFQIWGKKLLLWLGNSAKGSVSLLKRGAAAGVAPGNGFKNAHVDARVGLCGGGIFMGLQTGSWRII